MKFDLSYVYHMTVHNYTYVVVGLKHSQHHICRGDMLYETELYQCQTYIHSYVNTSCIISLVLLGGCGGSVHPVRSNIVRHVYS